MIANSMESEINETGKIFSEPIFCSVGFLKNQLPPPPYHYFGNFLVHSEKGQEIGNYVNLMHSYM